MTSSAGPGVSYEAVDPENRLVARGIFTPLAKRGRRDLHLVAALVGRFVHFLTFLLECCGIFGPGRIVFAPL
jgi:hypothetical protein